MTKRMVFMNKSETRFSAKRIISLLFAVVMVIGVFTAVFLENGVTAKAALSVGDYSMVFFNVPETIYLTPGGTSFQYVSDQTMDDNGGISVNSGSKPVSQGANVNFYCPTATNVSISVSSSVSLGKTSVSSGNRLDTTFTSGSVLSNSSQVITWTATYKDSTDNKTKKAYAYSYVYSFSETEGTAAAQCFELRRSTTESNREILNWAIWLSGVYGMEASSSFTTDDIYDNVAYKYPHWYSGALTLKSGSSTDPDQSGTLDGCYTSGTGYKGYHGYFWKTDNNDGGTRDFYSKWVPVIYADLSRYQNAKDIPNLKVGLDIFENWGGKNDGSTSWELGYYKSGQSANTTNIVANTSASGSNSSRASGRRNNTTLNLPLESGTNTYVLSSIGIAKNNGKEAKTTTRMNFKTVVNNKSSLRSTINYAQNAGFEYTDEYKNALKDAYTVLGRPDVDSSGISSANSKLQEEVDKFESGDSKVYFNVPEVIYLTPGAASYQYVCDQTMDASGNITVNQGYKAISSGGNINFYCPGATNISITASHGSVPADTNNAADRYDGAIKSGTWSSSTISGYIKWTATYKKNGETYTKTAFTYVYAPLTHSVGAIADARSYEGTKLTLDKYKKYTTVSVANWITGIHGLSKNQDESYENKDFGAYNTPDRIGYFTDDPATKLNQSMYKGPGIGNVVTASSDSSEQYVRQFYYNDDSQSNDSSSERSATGILCVDSSRFSNLNTVPNLYVGAEEIYTHYKNGEIGSTHFISMYIVSDKSGASIDSNTSFDNNNYKNIGNWNVFAGYYSSSNNETFVNTYINKLNTTTSYFNTTKNDSYTTFNGSTKITGDFIKAATNVGNSFRIYAAPDVPVSTSINNKYIYVATQGRYGSNDYKAGAFSICRLSVSDKSDLRKLVAESMSVNTDAFSASAADAFNTALENAYKALDKVDNDSSAVSNAYDALFAAKAGKTRSTAHGEYHNTLKSGDTHDTSILPDVSRAFTLGDKITAFAETIPGYDYQKMEFPFDVGSFGLRSASHTGSSVASVSVNPSNDSITFKSASGTDNYTTMPSSSGDSRHLYYLEVEPGAKLTLSADIEGSSSQMYIFCLDASGKWTGDMASTYSTGHQEISKEIPSGTKYVCFRFGNTTSNTTTTFKNITCSYTGNSIYLTRVQKQGIKFKFFYKPKPYTITLDGNGATTMGTEEVVCMMGERLSEIDIPSRTGYSFLGYYDAASGGNQYYSAAGEGSIWNKSANATLYAHWQANTYTVTFDSQGATTAATPASTSVVFDSALPTITKPEKTGYTFGGFYTGKNGAGTRYYDENVVKLETWDIPNNTTLYAKWTANTYTIAFDANGGSGTVDPITATYDVSYNLTKNSFTKTGYEFDGWATYANGAKDKDDQASVKNLTTANGATYTYYARWIPITYTVAFNGNGATSGSTNSVTATYDKTFSLTANGFDRRYKVSFVYNESDGGDSDADKTAVATWAGWAKSSNAAASYTTNGGTVSENLTTTKGATVTLYAKWNLGKITLPTPTKTGYDFEGWYTSSDFAAGTRAGGGGEQYEPHEVITLYAHWTIKKYQLDLNGYLDGKLSGNIEGYGKATVSVNESIKEGLTDYCQDSDYNSPYFIYDIKADPGHTYDGWTDVFDPAIKHPGETSVSGYILAKDNKIQLIFHTNTFTVHYNANGGAKVSGSMDDQAFTYGKSQAMYPNGFSNAYVISLEYNGADNITEADKKKEVGCTFVGWAESADGEAVYSNKYNLADNKYSKDVDKSTVQLYAKWENSTTALPKPEKLGYTFGGWYEDPEFQKPVSQNYLTTGDITLYAKWNAVKYQNVVIAYDYSTGVESAIIADNDTLPEGGVISLGDGILDKPLNTITTATNLKVNYYIDNNNYTITKDSAAKDAKVKLAFKEGGAKSAEVIKIYYEYKFKDGSASPDQFITGEIKFVPANNVYYEETEFSKTNSVSSTTTDDFAPSDWSEYWANGGSSAATNDYPVYGYSKDRVKDIPARASNGKAYRAEVSGDCLMSKPLEFEFTGSGFDLYSACGKNTSVLMVYVWSVSGSGSSKTYTPIANAAVDTFMNDSNLMTEDNYGQKLLHQVPVYHFESSNINSTVSGDESGTYLVQVYSLWIDNDGEHLDKLSVVEALQQSGLKVEEDILEVEAVSEEPVLNMAARETTCYGYVDGIRVYKPYSGTNANLYENSYIDTEKKSQFFNLKQFSRTGAINEYTVSGFNGETANPINEVYLAPYVNSTEFGATAFKVSGFNSATNHVMISARAITGAPEIIVRCGDTDIQQGKIKLISGTEMYYDITDYITADEKGDAIVYIQQADAGADNGYAAICSVKITESNPAVLLSKSVRLELLGATEVSMAAEFVNSVAPEDVVEYNIGGLNYFVDSGDPQIEKNETEPEIPDVPDGPDGPGGHDAENPTIYIAGAKSTYTVDYRSKVNFYANVKNVPDGGKVVWYDGTKKVGEGTTYTIEEAATRAKITAKVLKADGTIAVETDSVTVNVRGGFIQKLIAFFKKLLKILPVVNIGR